MIDFTFTEEQEMLRQAAREFAETKVAPKIPEMEESGMVNDEVVKALGEAEMMALTIPEEYGGLGLGYTARLIALEEIGRVSVATAMMLQVLGLGIEPIMPAYTFCIAIDWVVSDDNSNISDMTTARSNSNISRI